MTDYILTDTIFVSMETRMTGRNKTSGKLFILLLIILVGTSSFAIAQQAMSAGVLRSVDNAFVERSSDMLITVLVANVNVYDYPQLEEYTLRKIRQYIVQNELDFAKIASLALIDNNLDNEDAVALYSSITNAIDKRDQMLADQKRMEEELAQKRLANANSTTNENISKNYQSVKNVSSGEAYYYDLQSSGYSPISWNIGLGVVDFLFEVAPEETSSKYGLSISGDFFYSASSIVIGGEFFLDCNLISFAGNNETVSSVKFIPQLAFKGFTENLFFRLGFFSQMQYKNFISPLVGVGFRTSLDNGLKINCAADYFPGHFANEDMNAAFAVGADISYALVKDKLVDVALKAAVSDTIYMYKSGLENNIKFILSVEVGKND